ncbi:MAG: DUF2911 domain-containing protein [Balneolaceae bacterium]|nr:DUF2911 domain-containing protein [Balneolaceae bacterium]
MKKLRIAAYTSVAVLFFVGLSIFEVNAQERGDEKPRVSPNASVSQTIGTAKVTITYGRPSVNERNIFGGLVPYDKVWRTGANEATTITFSKDVMIEGKKLEAGTYGLFTIPGEKNWTVIFNNVPNQWGAFDYDSAEDALRVKVTPREGRKVEQMMFYFTEVSESSGLAVMHWNEVIVPFKISVPQ